MTSRRTQDFPTLQLALWRILPRWISPQHVDGRLWRSVVNGQMIAMVCRDTLIMEVLGLEWYIRPRDPDRKEELSDDVDHYTEVFLRGDDWGYDIMVDRLLQDTLDLPFGGALEIGRGPGDRVDHLYNVDGATLAPTPDPEWPVVQMHYLGVLTPVVLHRSEVERIFITPRTSIERRGYGMAPPEKIYFALELLARGDRYYANLLLDTPAAGILDLVDISEGSARDWVGSFRELMIGPEAFKIPVLYEHEKPATWIPFTQSPSELLFDVTSLKYAGLVAAGYGMTLRDIGIGDPQRTMASQIREGVQSARHGFGMLVVKLKYMFDRILPPELEWKVRRDDVETLVARGRARLSMARGYREMEQGPFTAIETRRQALEDGFVTTDFDPDDYEEDELEDTQVEDFTQEHHLLGDPVSTDQGGEGELRPS